MAKMELERVSIDKAENGFIVRACYEGESKGGMNKYEDKTFVASSIEEASDKIKSLVTKGFEEEIGEAVEKAKGNSPKED